MSNLAITYLAGFIVSFIILIAHEVATTRRAALLKGDGAFASLVLAVFWPLSILLYIGIFIGLTIKEGRRS